MPVYRQKILFIINHKSGNTQLYDLEKTINIHAQQNGYDCCLYVLSENPTNGIIKSIEYFAPEIVVAVGGDGTVNMVASVIKFTGIKLMIIPYGSANGMAKELNIPTNINDCLALLNPPKRALKNLDLLLINGKNVIHLADVGLNARIVYRFQMGKTRGMLSYAKHLLSEILLLGYKKFTITINDSTIKTVKAVSLTFANATKYGTGAVINPDGMLDDGLFEICVVKPFPKINVFNLALQMFRNRLKYSQYFEVIQCHKAVIRCKNKTTLQYDGEVLGKIKEIKIAIQKHALQVIIPLVPINPRFVH
ncbi:MAG: diacylglycerol kinase [Sphingobacteriales bacterium]|nr:MAG: diacylglycerol kinase [Sphingobacteriales bacterium]TAF81241.1 MAG: diacylglycerol kinase [Sphingobacteriales bacterium]